MTSVKQHDIDRTCPQTQLLHTASGPQKLREIRRENNTNKCETAIHDVPHRLRPFLSCPLPAENSFVSRRRLSEAQDSIERDIFKCLSWWIISTSTPRHRHTLSFPTRLMPRASYWIARPDCSEHLQGPLSRYNLILLLVGYLPSWG